MKRPLLLLGCLALTLPSRAALASDATDLEALLSESVVSGASKVAETATAAPATTFVMTGQELRRHGLRSLAEAIAFLGRGLYAESRFSDVELGSRGVSLTGDYGNHLLLVVDGHAENEQWDGTAYFDQGAGIPVELIDHIELVLGAGSVLYGSNAMLGVINVVTKKPDDYKGLHLVGETGLSPAQSHDQVTGFASKGVGYFGRAYVGWGAETTLLGRKVGVVGGAEYTSETAPALQWGPQTVLNYDGTPRNFGPNDPSGQWGGHAAHSFYKQVPTLYTRLFLGDVVVAFKATAYRRSTPISSDSFDSGGSYNLDRWMTLDVQWHKSLSERLGLDIRAYGDSYDYQEPYFEPEPQQCSVTTVAGCKISYVGASRWAGLEPRASFDWFGDAMFSTMVGADARIRWAGQKTDTSDLLNGQRFASSGVWSGLDGTFAAYVQQQVNPLPVVHLSAGARLDYDPRTSDVPISPRVAGVWDVWRGGAVKGVYAEAFRAPTAYELFFQSLGYFDNPNLKPEKVRSVEFTFDQRVGSYHIGVGVFQSWWHDMILDVSVPNAAYQGSTYQYQNVADIDNHGYDITADMHEGAFRAGLNVTGAYALQHNSDKSTAQLNVAPSLFGNVHASYEFADSGTTFALAAHAVNSRLYNTFAPPPAGGFPTYVTVPPALGLRAAVNGSFGTASHLRWRATVDWNSSSQGAYAVGPNQYYNATTAPGQTAPELMPLNRLTGFVTLSYDTND